jgi:hypothetical protein
MYSKFSLVSMLAMYSLNCSAALVRADIEKIGRANEAELTEDSINQVNSYINENPTDILGYTTKVVVLIKTRSDTSMIEKAANDAIQVIDPADVNWYRFVLGNAMFQYGYCKNGIKLVSSGGFDVHIESSYQYTMTATNYLECMRLEHRQNLEPTYKEVLSNTNFNIEATLSYLNYLLYNKKNKEIMNVVSEYEKRKPRSQQIIDFLCHSKIVCIPERPIK